MGAEVFAMAASPAYASFSFTWTDLDGNVISPAPRGVAPPYSVSLYGSLPIPAGTASGTEVDIPFTGIAAGATHVAIENKTGQELGMAWGGNFMPSLPPGALVQWTLPSQVQQSGRSVTSLRFFLTETQPVLGHIVYQAVGA
jgi:hypothetical protein